MTSSRSWQARDELAIGIAWLALMAVALIAGLFPTLRAFAYVEGIGLIIGGSGLYLCVRFAVFDTRSSTFWLLLLCFAVFIVAQGFFQFIAPRL